MCARMKLGLGRYEVDGWSGSFRALAGVGRATVAAPLGLGISECRTRRAVHAVALLVFAFAPEFGRMRRAMVRCVMVPHIRGGVILDKNYAWTTCVDAILRTSLTVFGLPDSLGIYGRLCWGFAW